MLKTEYRKEWEKATTKKLEGIREKEVERDKEGGHGGFLFSRPPPFPHLERGSSSRSSESHRKRAAHEN